MQRGLEHLEVRPGKEIVCLVEGGPGVGIDDCYALFDGAGIVRTAI
jgi:hypothetical protein